MSALTDLLADDAKIKSFYDHPRLGRQHIPDGLIDLVESRRMFRNVDWFGNNAFKNGEWDGEETEDIGDADLVASQRRGTNKHAIMFDIDHPARLDRTVQGLWIVQARISDDLLGEVAWVLPASTRGAWLIPSTKEGHHHLYADVDLLWGVVSVMLTDLADAGVVERGYLEASDKRGATALRLPWVAKEPGAPSSKGKA